MLQYGKQRSTFTWCGISLRKYISVETHTSKERKFEDEQKINTEKVFFLLFPICNNFVFAGSSEKHPPKSFPKPWQRASKRLNINLILKTHYKLQQI
jgi:hypothetical protein